MSIPKLKTLSKQVNTALYLEHRALIEEYWSTRPWVHTCRLAAALPFQPSVYGLRTHTLQHKLIQHLRVEGEISLHFLIRQTCNRVIKISFLPSHSFTIKEHQPSVKISGSCHSTWLHVVVHCSYFEREHTYTAKIYVWFVPLPRLCKAAIKWGLK